MKAKNTDMLRGPLFSGILSYTIPIILTGLLQLAFNAADQAVVGQFCGSLSVAAVGATGPLTGLLVNLFMGLSVGAGVTVAHGLGSDHQEDIHRIVHTALPAAVICGVILTVVGVVFSEDFLIMMATPENILPLSSVYIKIYFAGMTFTMVYNFCASILRAAGDTVRPLAYLLLSGMVNVVLNIIFVALLDMNVAGVALATTLSQGLSAVLVVWALMRRTDACRLNMKKLRIYPQQLLKIVRIGIPAGVRGSLFAISNVIIQSSINSLGDVFVSGNTAACNIEGFLYVIANAFGQTIQNYTGQNVGAGQYKRVSKAFWICTGCGCVVTMVMGFSAYFLGETLLSVFIPDSQEAIAYGLIRMGFTCIPYFIGSIMEVTTGALHGLGASMAPMLISVLGICGIRLLWIATVFQANPILECLFVVYPISSILTIIVQFVAFWVLFHMQQRKRLVNMV